MDYFATLARWQSLSATIKHLQEEEKALREGIFYGTFPQPTEGVNSVQLPDGRTLKGTYKLNRSVKQDAVPELPAALRKAAFKSKFELKVGDYKKLSEEERQQVDVALTISPGLPTIEIVEAKPDVPPVGL